MFLLAADHVPGVGRQDRAVDQGLGHRRQLHAPHPGGGEAFRTPQAARSHAHHRVPPGRGTNSQPSSDMALLS